MKSRVDEKRVLFIINTFYPDGDAAANIAEIMVDRYKAEGWNIDVLTRRINKNVPIRENRYGVNIFRILDRHADSLKSQVGFISKVILGMIKIIHIISRTISTPGCDNILVIKYINMMRRLVAQHGQYNVIIAVCGSYSIAKAITSVKAGSKSLYLLDPYFGNPLIKGNKVRMAKFEKGILQSVDIVVMLPTIYDSINSLDLDDSRKYNKLEFPNLLIDYAEETNYPKEYIECVYAGNIDANVRDPEYLFSLFRELQIENVRLKIVGGMSIGLQKKYRKIMPRNTKIIEKLPHNEFLKVCRNADFLINIGNIVSNMVPSKIFEYIGLRKPIINIVKINNCPTVRYLEKYPIKINLYEDQPVSFNCNVLNDFIIKNNNKRVSCEEIEQLFNDFNQDIISKEFYRITSGEGYGNNI